MALVYVSPKVFGHSVENWTLSLLCETAVKLKLTKNISTESARRILREKGLVYRRSKTHKEVKDPDTYKKWRKIRRLYRRCPKGSPVLCFDEMGPISLEPRIGRHWCRKKVPLTVPATYSRTGGISYFLAVYDVHRDWLWGEVRLRRTKKEVLSFLKKVRRFYQRGVVRYIIMDNLNIHRSEEVQRWAEENNVILVYTAKNASWQNRIESQFSAIRKRLFDNNYWPDHESLRMCFDFSVNSFAIGPQSDLHTLHF